MKILKTAAVAAKNNIENRTFVEIMKANEELAEEMQVAFCDQAYVMLHKAVDSGYMYDYDGAFEDYIAICGDFDEEELGLAQKIEVLKLKTVEAAELVDQTEKIYTFDSEEYNIMREQLEIVKEAKATYENIVENAAAIVFCKLEMIYINAVVNGKVTELKKNITRIRSALVEDVKNLLEL